MLSNLFYRRSRLTVLAVGLALVAGGAAFQSLARQEDPTLVRRFGSVTSFFPGASALRVETLVTEKIEDELLELHEIRELASLSRSGVSVLQVELEETVAADEVDAVWSKVRDRLVDAERLLPQGATAPELEDRTSTAVTLIASLVWEGEGPPAMGLLTRIAESLETRLRNLPGTEETELFGEAEEEMRVEVDPAVLADAGLTAGEVASALARADAKVPAGQLRSRENDLLLEVGGELTSAARIRDVPLRNGPEGRGLRVGDVAEVSKTVRDPPETLALLDGRRGIAVAATMESGLRVDLWAEEARAVVEGFRAEVPRGVGLELTFDQSGYTEERLGTLAGNLLLGALIVTGVLFVMMGLRSAVVVASALPLTVAMVLAELNAIDMPLHQTSVTGLIIALGLLIDNAIVVVDDLVARARNGLAPGEAVAASVRHLFVPLLASTLTTILAFLPIVLMPGGAGEFVGPISVGVGFSLASSFLLAMTVIPAFAGRFAAPRAPGGEGPRRWWREGLTLPPLTALYRRTLDAIIRVPLLGVAVSCALPVAGFVAGSTLTEQFFPPNDRNQFQIQLVLPAQASVAETREAAERARKLVEARPEVRESHWFVGESAPRVFYNMFGNQDGISSYAGAFVTTDSAAATERLLPELQSELAEALPRAMAIALPFEQGPPFDAPIEVRLVGPELETLRRLGEEVRAVLARADRVTYTNARVAGGLPKVLLRADEREAGLAGLRLVDIADQLQQRLEGVQGGSVLEGAEELPVRVRAEGPERRDLARIASQPVRAPGGGGPGASAGAGGSVPLPALARTELVPELSGITRRNGERTNTVQAYLEPYSLIAASLEDFRRRLDASDFELPPGFRLEFGGEREERTEAVSSLLAFALPLFVLMAGTIVLSFDSFRLAGVIGAVAFLSVGLALFGVWLFGHPMGFLAIVGTMGLVGLAINGGIVVLSALRADPRACEGDPEAVREVVVGATRHIVATTLTTIGGFIPLIALGGRFWPPLATAIAGGVGGAAILSLYLVPSLFVLLDRRRRRAATRSS